MRRGFWPLRDVPVLFWLTAAVVAIATQPWHVVPRWLMIHLLLLGALTHSIFIWSQFFTDGALKTRLRPLDHRARATRLVLLNLSVGVVVAGVLIQSWPVIVIASTAIAATVTWHGLSLGAQIRSSSGRRFVTTARYYVSAAALLPVGIGFGVALSHGLGDTARNRVWLAHVTINVLGWIGLTIIGTLLTLWPTMLRTQIIANAERSTQRALPIFLLSIVVVTLGCLLGERNLAAAGIIGYLLGLGLVGKPFVLAARKKPPQPFATWSVLGAMCWFVACLTGVLVIVVVTSSPPVVAERLAHLFPFVVVGTAAQILLGALTYLVPMSLGGGPSAVRAASKEMDRLGAFRFTLVNAGLVVCALPVPSLVRSFNAALVVAGLGAFVPLMFRAIFASRRAARKSRANVAAGGHQGRAPAIEPRSHPYAAMITAGLLVVSIAVACGVVVTPALRTFC